MKKSIALVALAFGVSNAFAQDLTSKKGEPFLPEAGDYMIGIDATPFLNYVGNFFGKTAANAAPTFNFMNGNKMILGKYFKDASLDPGFYSIDNEKIFFTSKKYGNHAYFLIVINPESEDSDEHMMCVLYLEEGLTETDHDFFEDLRVRDLLNEWSDFIKIKNEFEIDSDDPLDVLDYPGQFMVKVVDGIFL